MFVKSLETEQNPEELKGSTVLREAPMSIARAGLTVKEFKDRCQLRGINLEAIKKQYATNGKTKTDQQLADQVLRFTASDATVDRMGDIINPNGWDLTAFKSNPVFLLQHNSRAFPIGMSVSETIDKKALPGDKTEEEAKEQDLKGALVMDIFFHKLTKESSQTFLLFDTGMLRTVSVGFRPKEIRDIRDDKERQKLGLGPWGMFFEKQSLLELSAVTIPANPNAMIHEGKSTEVEEARIEASVLSAVKTYVDEHLRVDLTEAKRLKEEASNIFERNAVGSRLRSTESEEDEDSILEKLGDSISDIFPISSL